MIPISQLRYRLRWGALLAVLGAVGLLVAVRVGAEQRGVYMLLGAMMAVGIVRVVITSIALRRVRSKQL